MSVGAVVSVSRGRGPEGPPSPVRIVQGELDKPLESKGGRVLARVGVLVGPLGVIYNNAARPKPLQDENIGNYPTPFVKSDMQGNRLTTNGEGVGQLDQVTQVAGQNNPLTRRSESLIYNRTAEEANQAARDSGTRVNGMA